jgi:replication-associated recombination protein RarA
VVSLLHDRTDLAFSCGKTTLARLIAKRTNAIFRELSATIVGINDVRPIFDEAKNALQLTGRCVYLSKPF